ncbi:hypothetical protein [Amycolatopsis methanolica]|uniref:hypothetical protein n=1 Tax=Amycolatopsis methanolica TaxID=1814 RepID=UPI00039AEA67|nr:hypothetical protein [Amycolatopsis methanolica]
MSLPGGYFGLVSFGEGGAELSDAELYEQAERAAGWRIRRRTCARSSPSWT